MTKSAAICGAERMTFYKRIGLAQRTKEYEIKEDNEMEFSDLPERVNSNNRPNDLDLSGLITMRKLNIFFVYILFQVTLLGGLFAYTFYRQKVDASELQEKISLVRRLDLTDLCLFTEASYTRHLSLSDFHTAFQDSPMALEHFPSGSLVIHLPAAKKIYENMD